LRGMCASSASSAVLIPCMVLRRPFDATISQKKEGECNEDIGDQSTHETPYTRWTAECASHLPKPHRSRRAPRHAQQNADTLHNIRMHTLLDRNSRTSATETSSTRSARVGL
jgi:hypothetical protein